ncbi:hypothetical protein D5086_000850 [Populus alba]|uniref:Uncharacterized protein n=1 Tax=Populus alba TaxID=43335 RepID=A0ACC4CX90_POPAL
MYSSISKKMGGRKSIGRRSDGKNGLNRSAYEEDSLPLVSSEENLLAIVGGDENQPTPIHSVPIMSSFNDRIRPILDAVDQLRHLMVQATIMAKCWPEIVRKINEKLNGNVTELNRMPKAMSSVAEFLTAFMEFIGSVKESLTKILVRGEYDEYPVSKELEKEIVTELMATNGGKLELMLEEAPSVAAKRKRLNASIELLREAKDVLSNIMGNVSA